MTTTTMNNNAVSTPTEMKISPPIKKMNNNQLKKTMIRLYLQVEVLRKTLEITKTLTSKFWGVASFLALPPPPPPAEHSDEQPDPSDPEDASPEAISGIRRDFAEIGGRFRIGISKLSTNIDVSEITKMASSFLQLSPEGNDYVLSKDAGTIGVTDEVLAFVRDITMHPIFLCQRMKTTMKILSCLIHNKSMLWLLKVWHQDWLQD